MHWNISHTNPSYTAEHVLRERESALLREDGVLSNLVCIAAALKKDNRLFVDNKLHGSVVDKSFHLPQYSYAIMIR